MNWKFGLPSGMRYRYLVLPPRKDAILSGWQAALFCLLSATLWARPSNLRVEYLENPLGIDIREPRLSWVVPHTVRGDVQTAYHVKVSSIPGGQGDLWDSGKVTSDQSIHVKYKGTPRVRTALLLDCGNLWQGRSSHGVSEMGNWSMGLLEKSDWKGTWIRGEGASDMAHIWYRKKVVLDGDADEAFAYVASLGFHELYVNGQKVDDRLMAPTLTSLDKRVHYVTYDISEFLKKGENAIGIWYGPGWMNFRSYEESFRGILAQINIEAPTQTQSLGTDASWKWKLSSSEHIGGWGHKDAGGDKIVASRLEPDWNLSDYDDSNWSPAHTLRIRNTVDR